MPLLKTKVCLVAILVTLITTSTSATKTSGDEPAPHREAISNDTLPTTKYFNPMDLYVGSKEGVSLAHEDEGQKFSTYAAFSTDRYISPWRYKSLDSMHYTRILVGATKGNDVYPMTFSIFSVWSFNTYTRTENMKVHQNNDGTVSLSCESNGKYVTWGTVHSDECSTDLNPSGRCWSAHCQSSQFPGCLESGICPHCRYNLVVGSITDLQIRLVDLKWGNPEEAIPSSPNQVAEDITDNYSEEPIATTLKVVYQNAISDTTIWEHAWGFELSISAEVDVDIPFIGGGSVTTTATASYNGKYGTENTETSSETFEESKNVACPAHTRCILKYVAQKLDNYNIPFTATVERTQDDGPPLQWQEEGKWRGVQAFNFKTIYCTEDLNTGESNCPKFKWIQ